MAGHSDDVMKVLKVIMEKLGEIQTAVGDGNEMLGAMDSKSGPPVRTLKSFRGKWSDALPADVRNASGVEPSQLKPHSDLRRSVLVC